MPEASLRRSLRAHARECLVEAPRFYRCNARGMRVRAEARGKARVWARTMHLGQDEDEDAREDARDKWSGAVFVLGCA
eukprot:15435992-Alexandrium_andersonii.AAC.1